MNGDLYGILSLWKDFVFIIYWPLWLMPIYLFFRKKHLKNRWVFLIVSTIFCLVLNYLIEIILSEIFFNSGSAQLDKFAFEHIEAIGNLIFILGVLIPLTIVHFASKLRYFNLYPDGGNIPST